MGRWMRLSSTATVEASEIHLNIRAIMYITCKKRSMVYPNVTYDDEKKKLSRSMVRALCVI